MTTRRDILIGGACAASAALGLALKPRRQVRLLAHDQTMAEIVPRSFGTWSSQDVTDLVAPKIEGSLASKLYSETVGRVYENAADHSQVMMLLAYGDTQSDDLQLHRPEICYPAFGFAISHNEVTPVSISHAAAVPARSLLAEAPDRREAIVYWSRLGEYLPLDRKAQQLARVRTAMRGEIADGVLARFSMVTQDPNPSFVRLSEFASGLVMAVHPRARPALVGTRIANLLYTATA